MSNYIEIASYMFYFVSTLGNTINILNQQVFLSLVSRLMLWLLLVQGHHLGHGPPLSHEGSPGLS